VTFRRLRFTSSMQGTSPWTPPPTKSPISFDVSCQINSRTALAKNKFATFNKLGTLLTKALVATEKIYFEEN